jgi:peptidyl-prolyl cis-trans isomerase SurA
LIQARKQRRSLYCFVAILITTLALTGCPNRAGDKDVMARVNGYKVLRSEVDKTFTQQMAGSPQKPTPAEEEALRLNILSQIIYRQLLLQKAEKLGVVATDDEVETRFNQAKAPYTQEQFQKQLKDGGLTEEDYKLELRRTLTVDKLLNKEIASKVNISDADINAYYDQNKVEFNLIEPRYRLATIYVSNQPSAEPGQPGDRAQLDAKAKAKIQMVHNRLDSGEDFGELAQKYSDDPDTGRNGGAVQPIPESQVKNFDPATRDAVQRLKPGQYSEIIPSINPQTRQQNGYQIIRLTGKDIAGQRDLNDPQVQQFIRSKLRSQREQILRAAYDEELRNNAQIHNYFAEQILNKTGSK